MDQVEIQLASCFATTFGVHFGSSDELKSATIKATNGWDSLGHVRLIVEIRRAFSVDIKPIQAASLLTGEDLLAFLKGIDQDKT